MSEIKRYKPEVMDSGSWGSSAYMEEDEAGDYVKWEDVQERVKLLTHTVAWNMFHDAVRACAEQWGHMKDGKWLDEIVWPPMPEVDTVTKDGYGGIERDFTKDTNLE